MVRTPGDTLDRDAGLQSVESLSMYLAHPELQSSFTSLRASLHGRPRHADTLAGQKLQQQPEKPNERKDECVNMMNSTEYKGTLNDKSSGG